ncbi:MAG: hypothetical protein MKZ76_11410, partial [Pedosphaera sp.]|nr:hypothetical protein [Pedosphaera sp.]
MQIILVPIGQSEVFNTSSPVIGSRAILKSKQELHMKDQTYTINRYVEITQIKAGNYEVRCQDHTWYASTKKDA